MTYDKLSSRSYLRDVVKILPEMDFSAYPKDHPLFSTNTHITNLKELVMKNKAVLGLFKDELGGEAFMKRVIALRPKMYTFQSMNWKQKSTSLVPLLPDALVPLLPDVMLCKGLDSRIKNAELSYNLYAQVLRTALPLRHSSNTIRSYNHQLYILHQSKTSLSLYDNKRFWINAYDSVPFSAHACLQVEEDTHDKDTAGIVSVILSDHCYADTSIYQS